MSALRTPRYEFNPDELSVKAMCDMCRQLRIDVPRRGQMSETVYKSLLRRKINRRADLCMTPEQSKSLVGSNKYNRCTMEKKRAIDTAINDIINE